MSNKGGPVLSSSSGLSVEQLACRLRMFPCRDVRLRTILYQGPLRLVPCTPYVWGIVHECITESAYRSYTIAGVLAETRLFRSKPMEQ